jgi:hypothetical protein
VKSEISHNPTPAARYSPIVVLVRSSTRVRSTTASKIASRIGYEAHTLLTNNGTEVSLMLGAIQKCQRMSTAIRAMTAMSIRPSSSRRVRR